MNGLMPTTIPLPALEHPVITKLLRAPLSEVPYHEDTASITRFFAKNFPVHLAVHEVSPLLCPPTEYTQLHRHDDSDEVNIIISRNNLQYKIQVGDKEYIAGNNSAIWIPKGVMHSANVLTGSGYFITLRF